MSLPFNLQKLPPEALDTLRFMGKVANAVQPSEIEEGAKLSYRLVGKAIRRLINGDYIQIDINNGSYQLTTDGKLAVEQLAEYDAKTAGSDSTKSAPSAIAQRRLTVVMPQSFVAGRANDLYFGVNPPTAAQALLPETANIELKISAMGGTLSTNSVSLAVPPDKAAQPSVVKLTPQQAGKLVRIRVDAFQAFEFDSMESLGGMYFDIHPGEATTAAPAASRAVGMDLALRPPR
jgi:predicted transcriptional regulator